MTKLTTHVLDIYSGKPGNGIKVDLFYISGNEKTKLNSIVLNSDGRSDGPLIEKDNFTEVHFDVDFEIKNKFLNIIMAKSFQFGLNKIADAFQKRAESL